MTNGKVDVESQVFLISELVGGEWFASRHGRFTSGERTLSTHWIGPYRNSNSDKSVVQPVAILTALFRHTTGQLTKVKPSP
jgi:hypothetical protein